MSITTLFHGVGKMIIPKLFALFFFLFLEVGRPVFRRTFAAMLYSVVFYVLVGVFVVYTGVVKLQEMRELKSSEFDETVHGYMFLVYLVPHIAIPVCHWSQAEEIVNFMTAWTNFQVRTDVTHSKR